MSFDPCHCHRVADDLAAHLQTDNSRLKEENLQLQAKVEVLMSQLHGQVRRLLHCPARRLHVTSDAAAHQAANLCKSYPVACWDSTTPAGCMSCLACVMPCTQPGSALTWSCATPSRSHSTLPALRRLPTTWPCRSSRWHEDVTGVDRVHSRHHTA